jgi:uncharacterized membrane protein
MASALLCLKRAALQVMCLQMASLEKTLRVGRIFHVGLLIMVLILLQASYRLTPNHDGVPTVMLYAVVFVCANDVGLAAFFRRRMLRPSEEVLRSSPNNESALRKWLLGVIISLGMASTIAVFGLLLRVMGAKWNIASWFFLAGAVLLLLWTPRLDVSDTN